MNEKLSLCMICRDDEDNISRLVTAARPWVGEIVIIDTGSSDSSIEVAKRAGADIVLSAPELLTDGMLRSFSEARTLSYSLATRPWRLWLDSDDDLTNWELLPQLVENADIRRSNDIPGLSVSMTYLYTWNADRSRCLQSFPRERITHADDSWTWRRPIHEYLHRAEKSPSFEVETSKISVIHMSQGARGGANDRNLRILKHWEKNGGPQEDPIALFYYLGDEMLYRGRYTEAYEYFMRVPEHVTGTETWWANRSTFRAGRALMSAQKFEEAIEHFKKVLPQREPNADHYWELARALACVGDRETAKAVMLYSNLAKPMMGEDPTLRDIVMEHLGMTA